jgi:hypothetical protein
MKLWIDDERPAPEGWIHARTLVEALYYIYSMMDHIECIALDHDLGHPHFRDADVVASLIERLAFGHHIERMEWKILTNNPDGVKKIRAALERADEAWSLREDLRKG